MKLLSLGNTNAKTIKSDKIQDTYLTAILFLAPWKTVGMKNKNVCPKASVGCRKACLFTAGRGIFNSVQEARKRKTKLYFKNKIEFLTHLHEDIQKFSKKCEKLGRKPAIRLNGTSDILWELTGVMGRFPNVQFYDYTKIVERFYRPLPKNYHLTFSLHENNLADAKEVLKHKHNVAVVFRNKHKPKTFLGHKVIDGDTHDLRFLDKKGVIIGLKAKGKAKKDNTGFVIDLE